ncbi:reactive intermediate/imine deaminase [Sporosarcina sp. P2]|uniref:Rid family detoxifying hydrolase n=1 Tax=unclassified Sporosarcina TaxID=2647733 RepID=UPI000C172790|nr:MULTISPECIES: Rid family detoxifying hydrolase [unclassified Sporosarcina]PIC71254.1 reactive intermediate/imine deaminase [Sporosarcina sp. P16b]PID01589.1 reactive intermediate/imine deaminase [Sporosarcina sp. P2]
MFKKIHTDNAPAAVGAYSQAVERDNILFISGQLPINTTTNKMNEDIVEQAEQCLENIESILIAAGLSAKNVVKNTVYLTSLDKVVEVNEVYDKYFGDSKPARAMVGVKELPKNALVEIESIAIR